MSCSMVCHGSFARSRETASSHHTMAMLNRGSPRPVALFLSGCSYYYLSLSRLVAQLINLRRNAGRFVSKRSHRRPEFTAIIPSPRSDLSFSTAQISTAQIEKPEEFSDPYGTIYLVESPRRP